MYEATVTVFNSYKYRITGQVLWFPHVLKGVDFIADKGQMLKQYGPDSTDAAELHIAYAEMDDKKVIVHGWTGEPMLNTLGEPLPWLPPKEWARQVNDMLDDTITFKPDDFFWWGEWTQGTVKDEDYDVRGEGFAGYMNRNYDYVFQITTVGGPYPPDGIPHFEIRGA